MNINYQQYWKQDTTIISVDTWAQTTHYIDYNNKSGDLEWKTIFGNMYGNVTLARNGARANKKEKPHHQQLRQNLFTILE